VTSDHIYLKNYISDVNTVNILMLSTGAAIWIVCCTGKGLSREPVTTAWQHFLR
jgi:hypothetical protein